MSTRFWDAKRINHLLFGAWYEEDIYDRLCALFPRLAFLLKRCIPQAMRAKRLVFVHVPRVAGTSIGHALYGDHCVHHHSIRFFRHSARLYIVGTALFPVAPHRPAEPSKCARFQARLRVWV